MSTQWCTQAPSWTSVSEDDDEEIENEVDEPADAQAERETEGIEQSEPNEPGQPALAEAPTGLGRQRKPPARLIELMK